MAGERNAGTGDPHGDVPRVELAVHREGYDRFMKWLVRGTVASAITAAVAVVLIAS